MSEAAKGVFAMVAACMIWGLSPLLYKALAHIPPLEVLSHRTVWGVVFFLIVLGVQNRLGEIGLLFKPGRQLVLMSLAALMIASNWLVFIISVQLGVAVQASLGYYIFPLLMALVGVVMFREPLSRWQILAVVLAICAVATLAVGLGSLPLVAIFLSSTFAVYGALKKLIPIGPVLSVTYEVLFLAPIAVSVLLVAHFTEWGSDSSQYQSVRDVFLILLAGPVTAMPLVLMSYASRRIALATVGLVQYLNPSIQAAVAVFVFLEPFTGWHFVAFSMIWTALAIYSADSFASGRHKARRK